jgi:hypothetical protein
LLRRSDAAAETLEQTKDSKHGEQEQTNSCYENGYAEKRITGYLKNIIQEKVNSCYETKKVLMGQQITS